MIRYLIYHPIAVCVITLSLAILGIFAFIRLPVSLLPNIPIPEITVQASYPTASARELQRLIEQPIRNQLLQVNHLADIETITQNGYTVLNLRFEYGTDTHLAYLETNEKIDAILGQLPRDLERPKVVKASADDIPIFNLNVLPNENYQDSFLILSEFCENVLKRRIEQLPDVALVDITGLSKPEAIIRADPNKLISLGVTEQQLTEVLKQANLQPGNFNIREGPYQYNIRFSAQLKSPQDVENLYISIGGPKSNLSITAQSDPRVTYFADNVLTAQETNTETPRRLIALHEIATVSLIEQPLTGAYTFNNRRGVCLAIIKQNSAQLLHLRSELENLKLQFQKDYPQIEFTFSQDQTELLAISINNLISNLITGALLTFSMIFLFMNDRRLPILIGLVIPISIAVTFLGFYLLGLSINIVSLAGLILGMGEIVDSAIIILENIEEKRELGFNVEDSCIKGVNEVISPLLTSVLTNSAVFLPLILLSGLAGALFFDQAVSVSLALGISLICSYTLVPVLYYLLYRKASKPVDLKPTWIMKWLDKIYLIVFALAFRFKQWLLIGIVLIILGAIWMAIHIEKKGMPTISRTELNVFIDWNEPLTIIENQRRISQILQQLNPAPRYVSAFSGQQEFLLNRQIQQSENETLLSLQTSSKDDYTYTAKKIQQQMGLRYPKALVNVYPARNVFEQLFNTIEPPLRLKLYNTQSQQSIDPKDAGSINNSLHLSGFTTNSIGQQGQLVIQLQLDKLLLYDVDEVAIIQKLKTVFNNNQITNLQSEHRLIPLILADSSDNIEKVNWQNTFVYNRQKQTIALNKLINVIPQTDYKMFCADKQGVYIPFDFIANNLDIKQIQSKVDDILRDKTEVISGWSGQNFRNQTYLNELLTIVCVSILLLFCILTAQFESMQQPLIVLSIVLLGISGSMWMLYLANDSLNVLSIIGMVVLIGLLDNDSILKIDTMNRSIDNLSLMDAIRTTGQRRLKSQIMTFLTTVLGLLPVLFSGGLGAELQKPLALVVIGGMCFGVFISWTVIPLLYYWIAKYNKY